MEPGDSEQEEEDVYEVERIIDMRVEEVRKCLWKSCGCHLASDVACRYYCP